MHVFHFYWILFGNYWTTTAVFLFCFFILICFLTDRLTVSNLRNNTAYQVQIRHLSRRARNPLWSDWSPLVIVPTGKAGPLSGYVFVQVGFHSSPPPWKRTCHVRLHILHEWRSERLLCFTFRAWCVVVLPSFCMCYSSSPLETQEESLNFYDSFLTFGNNVPWVLCYWVACQKA